MNFNNVAADLEQEVGYAHAPEAEAGPIIRWAIRIGIMLL
jgi:hypothetical protein